MRLATYASVATAVILIGVKLAAWIYTDSVSLLSTLIDSLLDAIASLINLLAVRHALSPPDREHRFGHGKAEPLAALAQATFISGSAVFLVFEASHRLFALEPLEHVGLGIWVMVFAIVVTFVLTRFQAYVVRQTNSLAIEADSLHYVGDMLINGAVIVALLLVSKLGWLWADPVFGLAVPTSVPEVPSEALHPRETWVDGAAYDRAATELAHMFTENFRQFNDQVPESVRAAGPRTT